MGELPLVQTRLVHGSEGSVGVAIGGLIGGGTGFRMDSDEPSS